MRAVEYSGPGGSEVIRLAERPVPTPGAGEVLIRVAAAGLNRADVAQRQGNYPPPEGASDVPGLEVSGTIAASGPDVEGYDAGDRVCALLAGGGYAEYVAVPAVQVLPVPQGIGLVEAAGLPEVASTVWSNLFMEAGLSAGQWALIHGGAGGIGTMATQLATAYGAQVVVTAGSAGKIDYCRGFGAVDGINYREEDFVERMRTISDGHGADVVLDIMGAKYLARNLEVLAPDGRLVVIALQGGAKAELNLARLMTRRLRVIGTTLRARSLQAKGRVVEGVRTGVWPLVEEGTVRPVVEKTFPLAEAAAAHEYFDSGEHRGKILLTV
ncbi:MAG: NAD(P)H-quinone oxidoreductase [Arthrobacter sp.]|uniref:NAD(P)H-quinone oxidoreductase n=1 Tax=unclassified Arthrobacter TaxID=235627 RepID=UPI002652E2E4|nr:NAD(P)H-quinone oxidoreductase [Micrococcaceae bacterium]MDN5812950.1 NAD(P)H-quinone oxidoreductase [Micrococcaceae bacterium]MDN5823154.1 NAD(P)H-quinone oxidoreductase [Micrococcaceae bacterium]MDN5878212.1 NAD(P)H-quinone oxidoreductase [Micrococcaceae bacterium]MDN5885838.1 NAD(P)H-quinone oxidoreductase [Micrococcaceae bacterium]